MARRTTMKYKSALVPDKKDWTPKDPRDAQVFSNVLGEIRARLRRRLDSRQPVELTTKMLNEQVLFALDAQLNVDGWYLVSRVRKGTKSRHVLTVD